MKSKKFSLIALMAAAILITGCAAEDETVSNNGTAADKKPYTLSIEVADAGTQQDGATRAAYSGLTTEFETGDAIGVYAVDANGITQAANAQFTRQSDGTWTTSATVVFNTEWSYYAYYPYVSSPYTPDFTQSEVDDIFSLFIADASDKFHKADQSTKANYAASDLMIAKGTPSGTDKVVFSMYHKKGLAVLSGDGMVFTTFNGNIPYTNGNKRYYLMKPSTATSVGGVSITAASGKYVDCVYDMASIAAKATDVSLLTTAGVSCARSTANCYMIHDAGIYKLPLVYGNAITEGSTKETAYMSSATSNVMTTLVNHANQPISDPWIKNNTNGTRNIAVDGAELLWQDAKGMVDAVGIYEDYLVFRVPAAASTTPGNAVIAVKDGSDVVWSWHIWCTTETYAATTAVTTNANTYNVTAVNLGWVPTGGDGKLGYCPYYQWGRKDAFLPSDGASNTDHAAYDINGNTIDGIEKYNVKQNGSYSLSGYYECIQYPGRFFYDSGNQYYRWYSETLYNLWDINNDVTYSRTVTNKTNKTVYDPCPAGFCVPTQNLVWFMLTNNTKDTSSDWPGGSYSEYPYATWDGTYYGITYNGTNSYGIWFPAAGFRWGDRDAGEVSYVRGRGYYWSASPHGGSRGTYLSFNSLYWYCSSNSRASGQCVRPVSE